MKRISIAPRENFKDIVTKQGLTFHTPDKEYWHESAYYEFNSREINQIELATEELHRLYIGAADFLVENPDILIEKFGIPEYFVPFVIKSWNDESDDQFKIKCLNYGRFDLIYDGISHPKLLEYNCDTPTSLLEASIIQWEWKQDVFPELDQYNSIHEKMVQRYASLKANGYIDSYYNKIHFTGTNDPIGEDMITLAYHMDLCEQAEVNAEIINAAEIGWSPLGFFVDSNNKRIDTLFHLYPWEWLVKENFGKNIVMSNTKFLEPIWKMIWSNKAILPILWDLYAGHENLLPASFTPQSYAHVAKPILSREGANIQVYDKFGELVEQTGGVYENEITIYQKYHALPKFDDYYPIIGAWCINGYAAGMGIREDKSIITANNSIFTPHVIRD